MNQFFDKSLNSRHFPNLLLAPGEPDFFKTNANSEGLSKPDDADRGIEFQSRKDCSIPTAEQKRNASGKTNSENGAWFRHCGDRTSELTGDGGRQRGIE